jgi:hypothetical protein
MGLPHKAGKEVLVERSHVSPHRPRVGGMVFDTYERPRNEPTVEATMSKQNSGTPRPNQSAARFGLDDVRYDTSQTPRPRLASEYLVVVKPTFHRHEAGGEVLVRRRARLRKHDFIRLNSYTFCILVTV